MRNRYTKLFFLVYLFIHNYVCESLKSKYFYGQSIDKKKMPNENIQYNKFSIFDSVSFLNPISF